MDRTFYKGLVSAFCFSHLYFQLTPSAHQVALLWFVETLSSRVQPNITFRLLEVVDSAFIAYAVYFYLVTYVFAPSLSSSNLTLTPSSNWGNKLILFMRVQWCVTGSRCDYHMDIATAQASMQVKSQ